MIYAICGTPGSYKSAFAFERFLLPALKKNREVYTNIEGLSAVLIATYFDLDVVDTTNNLHILGQVYDDDGLSHEDVDKIRYFYRDLPQNALIIIDEAQNYFSSRDFKEGYSSDLIPWLTKHRHLGNDVVWITQSLESVDITFRRNTALTYSLRRMEHLGLKNRSIMYIFDRANLETRYLARKTFSPNPSIFKCYSSYQNKEVKENRTSYNVFLRSPMFIIFCIIIIYFIYTIVSGSFSKKVFHSDKKNLVKKQERVIEQRENKVIESQEVKHEDNQLDNVCIVSHYKIQGVWTFKFSDGTIDNNNHGRNFCY